MVFAALSVSLALLFSFIFITADAIRPMKEGPLIDLEGREYKTVKVPDFIDEPAVSIRCTEAFMIISIQADVLSNGHLVSPGELYLGDEEHLRNQECQAVPVGDNKFVIEADLKDCGSKLSVSDDEFVYSNNLVFSPAPRHHGITRMNEAVVPVSCHYKRRHIVSSSNQRRPLSVSSSAAISTEKGTFSLRLLDYDWSNTRFINTFYLGDPLHLEASYSSPVPRKLFVDSCVAMLTTDATPVPRYYFIGNHGCFIDARDGGLNSLFQPRTRPNSLRFQIEAFLFQNDLRNTIYITCEIRASRTVWSSNPISKSCNYYQSSWKNVDGKDGVCQCCNSVCPNQAPKDDVCDTLTLGPLIILPRK